MKTKRVALIGHSGAGKSACLLSLGMDRKTADMDAVLGTNQCPTLEAALDWLANDSSTPALVAVSNHEELLKKLHAAKLARPYTCEFLKVQWVYLHKPKDELAQHLARQTADGRKRGQKGVDYTLANYDRFDALFKQIADRTVECAQKSITTVAAEVQALVQGLAIDPADPGAPPDPASDSGTGSS